MQIVIGNVLSADEVALVREALAQRDFVDGRETAGFAARLVKNNRQAANDRTTRDRAQAGRGAHPRQRRLRAGGAAEGADPGDVLALRAGHALRQPCRRRADAGHAHRRVVHAVPVRPGELRRRRTGDRERGRRGRRQARGRQPRRLSVDRAASRRAGDARRRGSRRSAGRAAIVRDARAARAAVRSRHRAARRCSRARARAPSTISCRSRSPTCCGCGWRIERSPTPRSRSSAPAWPAHLARQADRARCAAISR